MTFWVIAFFLILFTGLVSVLPLLLRKNKQYTSSESEEQQHENANIISYKEHRVDIALRLSNCMLSREEYERLKLELDRKLLSELPNNTKVVLSYLPSNIWLSICLSVLIPLGSLLLYSQLGAHAELEVIDMLNSSNSSIEQIITSIESWVKKHPNNTQAMYLLGNQYLTAGRLDDAVNVFLRLYEVSDKHPQVSAQLAQVLFLSSGQKISAEVTRLYRESLEMQPGNTTALGLKGIDDFQNNNFSSAAGAWQQILNEEKDLQIREALVSGITRARVMMGEKVIQVTVRVNISSELKSLPDETRVIIFARESGTKSVPVAAVPVTIGDLPKDVVLNEASAVMMGGSSLANISRIDVFARVSLSGDAMDFDYQAEALDIDTAQTEIVELNIIKSH